MEVPVVIKYHNENNILEKAARDVLHPFLLSL